MKQVYLLVSLFLLVSCHGHSKKLTIKDIETVLELIERTEETKTANSVSNWLKYANEKLRQKNERDAKLEYEYETDINEENSKKMSKARVEGADIMKEIVEGAKNILKNNPDVDGDTRRQLELLSIDDTPRDPDIVKKLEDTSSKLESIYGKATLSKNGKKYRMEPELTKIMAKSRDPSELLWAWKGWRDVTGKKMKTLYKEYVDLLNTGARDNHFSSLKEAWLVNQFGKVDNLEKEFERLWKELKPVYELLHSYVRQKLKSYYEQNHQNYRFPEDGTIPAHLLGNMWAQEWNNIYDLVKPFPQVQDTNIDQALKQKYPTAIDLFKEAERFYASIGLYNMTREFWDCSMIERPDDREVQCHASATDFNNGKGFCIKMCTEINKEYFETIHHEMGHVEYFMAYAHQPEIYRTGANCGFHEAIGDTINLSVGTRKHLKVLKLLPDTQSSKDNEKDINFLMGVALNKIAFLPFGYLIDKWRWDVFTGKIQPQDYNKEWWEMRQHYQGISPPVARGVDDFDPGAKFHIPSNSPYICYFVSFVIQFQFHEALCRESGHSGPLHTCDIYESKAAGEKFKNMLALGGSKPWPDALQMLTGSRHFSADAIKSYFDPLIKWLKGQVSEPDIGWRKPI